MKKTLVWTIGFLLMMPVSLWALDFVVTDKELKSLSPEALALYNKGQDDANFVRYDAALGEFIEAAKIDSKNVPLRFLIARLAEAEAAKKMGDEAIGYHHKAEAALQEIVAMKDQGPTADQIDRAEGGLEMVKDRVVKQAEKDQRRQKLGKEIVKERAKEIYGEKTTGTVATKIPATSNLGAGMVSSSGGGGGGVSRRPVKQQRGTSSSPGRSSASTAHK